jgi:hypothetical protein
VYGWFPANFTEAIRDDVESKLDEAIASAGV